MLPQVRILSLSPLTRHMQMSSKGTTIRVTGLPTYSETVPGHRAAAEKMVEAIVVLKGVRKKKLSYLFFS